MPRKNSPDALIFSPGGVQPRCGPASRGQRSLRCRFQQILPKPRSGDQVLVDSTAHPQKKRKEKKRMEGPRPLRVATAVGSDSLCFGTRIH